MKCKYEVPYEGECGIETMNPNGCSSHRDARCCSCGAKATHGCTETLGGFVCGHHLCDDCAHVSNGHGRKANP
jgi:hypothetical protein